MTQQNQSLQRMMDGALEHHRHGRVTEAGEIYRQILALHPRHADCLHLLGMIAFQASDLETAADLIRKAIEAHPGGASYHGNLGTVLHAQGNLEEAEAQYRRALALRPNLAEVQVNLGNILQERGELEESSVFFERALALQPNNAEAHNNLGNTRMHLGQMEEAIACYERALAVYPEYAEALYNLGNLYRKVDRLDEAVASYQRALALKPDFAEALYNLGNVRREQGDVDEALRQFASALNARPEYTQAAFGEALAQLLQGDFTAGWPNFERRWKSIDHDTPARAYEEPAWAGEKLTAGSVLLWGEQGVGDEIMFAGLIPDAVSTGSRCVLDCDQRLNPLFSRSFPGVTVVSGCVPGSHPELDIAAQLPSGSLPGLFRKEASAFAATTSPYLFADPVARDRLRTRYADGRRLVGLAWYTNSAKTGRYRSIDLAQFAPLFAEPNIRWTSLQYGVHDELEAQAGAAGAPLLVDREVNQFADMDLFAAQIAAMDLVLTIDNSTAHLAGALGVPVWVLLPFAPDWRWLLDREDCRWYPTMRLFRQPKPGDWLSVVEKVSNALHGMEVEDGNA